MVWSPSYESLEHFLIIEFSNRMKICSISTKGRPSTLEFITEYYIQYSDNGKGWKSVKNLHGEIEV